MKKRDGRRGADVGLREVGKWSGVGRWGDS